MIRYFVPLNTYLLAMFLLTANPVSIYAISQSLKEFAKPLTPEQIIEMKRIHN